MDCEDFRIAISARLDGEAPGVEVALVEEHAATCPSCHAFSRSLSELHRAVRLRTPAPVPDLTEQVLARVDTPQRSRPEWARYALFTVAMTQLLVALPALLFGSDPGASVHVARELGSWDAALAVGLLYAAWKPDRAAGLLPFAVALTATTFITAALDVAAGNTTVLGESPHLMSLLGLALLGVLASTNWWSVRRITPEPAL